MRSYAMGVGWPDILIRKGVYSWMPPLPASPGSELSGLVEALGPGVSDITIGQGVLVSARNLPTRGGCYTELISVPASSLYFLPDTADLDEAACLGNYQVAWAILFETTRGFNPKSVLIMVASAARRCSSPHTQACGYLAPQVPMRRQNSPGTKALIVPSIIEPKTLSNAYVTSPTGTAST